MTPTPPIEQALPPAKPHQGGDDAATQRLQAELNKTKQQLDTLTQRVFSPQPPAPPQPQGGSTPDKKELEREFLKSPLDMSTAIAQRTALQVVGQAMGPAFDTMVEMAKSQARGNDPKLAAIFDKYEQEIVAQVMQVDAQLRPNVNVWKNAFAMVRGQHIDDIMRDAGQQPLADPVRAPGVIIRHGNGPGVPSAPAQPAGKEAELTADEKKWARKLKLTDDQYRQGKVWNSTQSDEYTDAVGPSSWDEFVTFDSVEARRRRRAKANAQK